jgi:16S rRNA (adenine1518-N6/adenine1519-N6)-dimethyltransferase
MTNAKKSLGQHFLKNKKALLTIVESLKITPEYTVIEIGPGHGELTDVIASSPVKKIIAIEKDSNLAPMLQEKYRSTEGRVEIKEGDALLKLKEIAAEASDPFAISGNIPYYITGHLLRIIGNLERKPREVVFTIQKEVAERICAQPPRMNRLAACIQAWGTPVIELVLPPGSFDPPPSIDSAILHIAKKEDAPHGEILNAYYETAGIAFRQPRKTLLNNIADGFGIPKESAIKLFENIGLLGTERPETITIEKLKKLSAIIHGV